MSVADRLEKLKEAKTLSWGELCDLLQVNRSMMHYLRTGERKPSPKLLRRIEEAEKEAGIGIIILTRELIPDPKTPAKAAKTDYGNSIVGKNFVLRELSLMREDAARLTSRIEALEREFENKNT